MSKINVLAILVLMIMVGSIPGTATAQTTIFHEDWETGIIDPARWTEAGSPAPLLIPGEGSDESIGLDPNGDSNCTSGVWTQDPVPWEPGTVLSMDFNTNSHGNSRSAHWQSLRFGLCSGWQIGDACDLQQVEWELMLQVRLNTGETDPETIKLHQRDVTAFHVEPYPADMDQVWHHLELRCREGGPFGRMEYWLDGDHRATATLQAPLPEPLYLFVDGRSYQMTNITDEIRVETGHEFDKAIAADLSCMPAAGTLPFSVTMNAVLANRLGDSEFSEDWEEGLIDPGIWTSWGSPAPALVVAEGTDGGYGFDPNGDGYCSSGVWREVPLSWYPGCAMGMSFRTNIYQQARQAHWQSLNFGLCSGWQLDGTCDYEGVEWELRFQVRLDTEEVNPETIRLLQGDVGALVVQPYPTIEDGPEHTVELRCVEGGPYDSVEFWFDGALLETVELQAPLPTPLNLFVYGRSVGLTNVVDEIYTRTPGSAALTRTIAGRIDVSLAGGSSIPNWRAGYTNVAPGASYVTSWSVNIPLLGNLIGDNQFTFFAEDVTPSPYNQPPYPASGDAVTTGCTITGIAP